MSSPQYPQYPPAPGPDYPMVPEQPTRPKLIESMAIATELWLVVIVGRVVAEFGQYSTLKKMFDDQITNAPKDTPQQTLDVWRSMSSPGFLIGMLVVGALVVGGLTLMVMWFARQGHNWARLLLAGAGMYVVVSMLWGLLATGIEPGWVAVPLIVAGVAGGGATVALLRRDTESWCADMALYRRQSKAYKVMPQMMGGWPPMPGALPQAQQPRTEEEQGR